MTTKKTKGIIVGYGRKSKEDKNAKGISLSNQKAHCQEWAKQRGYQFVYFEDNNKTGDNLNRQGYKDMINYVKQNKIKCIIVWKLDRLTRNIEDYYGIIQPFLREHNATVASVQDHFDDIFELEPMMLAVLMGMGAQELKNIKVRTKSVMEFRAKNGGYLGKAPVGYLNVRTKEKRGIIIPDPNKKHYIKQAFDLYATGIFSLDGVGRELAKFGFVNSLGKPYPKKRIEDILKNPVYMGKVQYEGELYDGKHEPIISEELFYRVQLRFSDTGNRRPKGDVKTYTGFIQCAKCGCAYTGLVKHGAHNSGTYTYYRCSNYNKVHTKERNINEHIIDEAMQEVIDSFDISDEQLKQVKKSIFEAVTELQSFEHKSIKELQQQYDKLTDTISNAVKQKLTGELDIDLDTYNELMGKWQDEKREVGNKINNLSESSKDTITRMNILTDFANRIPELYLKATLEEKRMILTTIAESIVIDDEAETITVKLRPVFEHLRLAKQSFKADLETLDGTLQTRSDKAKQALQNIRPDVNDIVYYGTRQKLMNTKIEPNFDDSKKTNVDKVTVLEPRDKEIITGFHST